MKKLASIYILLLAVSVGSCKKDFLDTTPATSVTVENYYRNAAEVNGATGVLYNAVWGRWFDKAFLCVGDIMAGTAIVRGDENYKTFYNFNILSTDGPVGATWRSCYKAAGSAAVLINLFEQKKKQVGDQAYLTQGIAEARFIRGFAYFYIARAFGDAPIVDDPVMLTEPGKYLVPRYLQKDVLRYALEDLKYAEEHLGQDAYQAGRVTKWAAKGMMAKLYLYSKDYANAKLKAKEVIDYSNANPAKVGLYGDYGKMFTSASANNNKESLFSLQWLASMGYNGGNLFQEYVAPQALLKPGPTNADGYSAVRPSLDMLNPATGYATGDKRRGWSVMEQGFHRADWINDKFPNGFKYDTTAKVDDLSNTFNDVRANILKYVIGPAGGAEPVSGLFTSMGTYILRYADVLLIYAEASLLSGGIDGVALDGYNAVHTRAGLSPVSTFTIDDILHERKVEFAFEGDFWFDIQRQGFEKAKQMVGAQERGNLNFDGTLNPLKVVLTSPSQLFLPVPQAETIENPALLGEAVPYY
ncbi:RagB/SusD family nutrient uptake outer membrane protein [Filimonas effusa]|uniref:RagB/SusD family nutrient uptake outer membrane protein n=1 Tax=Filimonas effusa TaxID=2508721 RepID=A0A4V1M9X9_9BACT|nr:RagB/SusD family nutrient uptake outer membrane protein [Filimonas effusa]RXK83234.1 RagB/SusD family nutrient uptake outer membrane protein [Filimonas effusa]